MPLLEVGRERVQEGEMVGVIYPMYNISLFGIVTMNASCTINIS
jgi:hypothetical protein